MKILVADDDPITRESLDACLKSEGFDVVLAQNGARRLRMWEKHRPEFAVPRHHDAADQWL